MNNDQSTIDLQELLLIFFKNILLIAIITALFTAVVALYTVYQIPKKYESSTMIAVSYPINSDSTNSASQFTIGSALAVRYSIIAKSDAVIGQAYTELVAEGVNVGSEKALENCFTVTSLQETDILQITVTATDPEVAQEIAAEITKISSDVYTTKYNTLAKVNVIDNASANSTAVSPNVKLNIVIGFVLGLMVSVGTVLMKEFINRKVKSEKDLENILGIPYYGSVPDLNKIKIKKLG